MANVNSKDGEFDFQKDIYSTNGKKIVSEKELALRNKIKAVASVAITTGRPKIAALDSYSTATNLPKIKLFSNLLEDVALGVVESSVGLNEETFLISKGYVSDALLVGNANDPVYASETGEMTMLYSNCKVGFLVESGIVMINIGVESSNNDLSLKYDFMTTIDLPTLFRKMTYYKGFFESAIPAGEEGMAYVSIAHDKNNNVTIAVSGEGTKRIIRSTNCGLTWTPIIAPAMNAWTTVAFGNGTFVALSSGGSQRCMTSKNGITWQLQTVDACAWRKIIFANGKFVAVASSGVKRLMTSTDGINWAKFTVPLSSWRDIAYEKTSNIWMVSGINGFKIMVSSDNGLTWGATNPIFTGAVPPSPLSLPILTLTATAEVTASGIFTVTGSSFIARSYNGVSWDINGFISNGDSFSEYNFETNYLLTGNSINVVKFLEFPVGQDYGIADTINPISAIGMTNEGAAIVLTSGLNNKFYRTYKL